MKNLLSLKNFRQNNYLVISLGKPLLSWKFCQERVRVNFCNFHTVHCGNYGNLLSEKILFQITYLVISLVKVLLSRNFCQKRVRVNFRNFHTVPHNVEIAVTQCGDYGNSLSRIFSKTFVKVTVLLK